uniref:4-alpha-glucanotransferase n=1 Tax=Mycobacterium sp. UM_Kg27 TaxID=1545693 RepID=UPI00061AD68C
MAPDDLRRLATAHGVATAYRNERREMVQVDEDVVVRVLRLLEVEARSAADRRHELARLDERERAGVSPPTAAVRVTGRPLPFSGAAALVSEGGERTAVRDELPADLSPGWYQLQLRDGQEVTLVAAPARVPRAPLTWGWMLQLYALRSARSWGIGDLADLRDWVRWTAAEHGAGAVLLNPLHAPGPTYPVQPSPYTPSSRQFANPLALCIADLAAYQRADSATRAEVDALRVAADTARIDYDLVWAAKRAALELLWRSEGRPCPLDESSRTRALRDWATYCALAERCLLYT